MTYSGTDRLACRSKEHRGRWRCRKRPVELQWHPTPNIPIRDDLHGQQRCLFRHPPMTTTLLPVDPERRETRLMEAKDQARACGFAHDRVEGKVRWLSGPSRLPKDGRGATFSLRTASLGQDKALSLIAYLVPLYRSDLRRLALILVLEIV